MKQEISPKETSRAQAFELWMKSPDGDVYKDLRCDATL